MSTLEDRINDCFERSMNGSAMPTDSRDMRDMVAYMTYLSKGAPTHGEVHGEGLPDMTPLTPDRAHGGRVFAERCVACHGPHGSGTVRGPALWGAQSYNIGAGMARLRTAASFIKHNMPLDNASLTDQQAFDVAAYINGQRRPDFARKAQDWPKGDAPPDVPYRTEAAPRGATTDSH
jgi:thiosulfate dehydrogenase